MFRDDRLTIHGIGISSFWSYCAVHAVFVGSYIRGICLIEICVWDQAYEMIPLYNALDVS